MPQWNSISFQEDKVIRITHKTSEEQLIEIHQNIQSENTAHVMIFEAHFDHSFFTFCAKQYIRETGKIRVVILVQPYGAPLPYTVFKYTPQTLSNICSIECDHTLLDEAASNLLQEDNTNDGVLIYAPFKTKEEIFETYKVLELESYPVIEDMIQLGEQIYLSTSTSPSIIQQFKSWFSGKKHILVDISMDPQNHYDILQTFQMLAHESDLTPHVYPSMQDTFETAKKLEQFKVITADITYFITEEDKQNTRRPGIRSKEYKKQVAKKTKTKIKTDEPANKKGMVKLKLFQLIKSIEQRTFSQKELKNLFQMAGYKQPVTQLNGFVKRGYFERDDENTFRITQKSLNQMME
jgi:hypothetical protein